MITGIVAGVCGALFVGALVVTLCVMRALFTETEECKKAIRADANAPDDILRVVQEEGSVTVICGRLSDKRSVPDGAKWRRAE